MPQLNPVGLFFLLCTAIIIPVLVFQIGTSEGKLTFKARDVNDTGYLSQYYQVQYRQLKEIYKYIKDLVKSYSFFCRFNIIGYTTKKGVLPSNPIYVLRISSGFPKPIILIVAGINANDWQTVTSVLYIANQLLANCTKEGDLIVKYDWYFVPILNPDGYNYSQITPAAMDWIKNKARWSMDYEGVNLDYNFGYRWRKNYNFNEDTYPGIRAFSEAESKALKSLINDIQRYIEIVFILKTPMKHIDQAPAITYPWSYSNKKPKNWALMSPLGHIISCDPNNFTSRYTMKRKADNYGRSYFASGLYDSDTDLRHFYMANLEEYLALEGVRAAKKATGEVYKVIQSGKQASNQTGKIDDWLLGSTDVTKILTIQTKYIADLLHDPYKSILIKGTETFAIMKSIARLLYHQPQSYRRTHPKIEINEVVNLHVASRKHR